MYPGPIKLCVRSPLPAMWHVSPKLLPGLAQVLYNCMRSKIPVCHIPVQLWASLQALQAHEASIAFLIIVKSSGVDQPERIYSAVLSSSSARWFKCLSYQLVGAPRCSRRISYVSMPKHFQNAFKSLDVCNSKQSWGFCCGNLFLSSLQRLS